MEFNDRYSRRAPTTSWGVVAQEQRQWAQARSYLLKDLEITWSFKDEHGLAITLRSMARLWQASGDTTLPSAVAEVLGTTSEEAEALLRQALPDEGQE